MTAIIVENVVWTDEAKSSFGSIVNWLKEKWSEKEINKLIQRTENLIKTLQQHPESCRPSLKKKNVRIAILDKHTQLFYHYNAKGKTITVLLFWEMKQNPQKLKY